MNQKPVPVFRTTKERTVRGTMAVYASQAEASAGIPRQWSAFRKQHPGGAAFYGASPCTGDHKIHYLAGVEDASADGEELVLATGEYAVVRVEDPKQLRDTWVWLLSEWLPNSGRRERRAPEFERFTDVAEDGSPVGPVEIWIPVEGSHGD